MCLDAPRRADRGECWGIGASCPAQLGLCVAVYASQYEEDMAEMRNLCSFSGQCVSFASLQPKSSQKGNVLDGYSEYGFLVTFVMCGENKAKE